MRMKRTINKHARLRKISGLAQVRGATKVWLMLTAVALSFVWASPSRGEDPKPAKEGPTANQAEIKSKSAPAKPTSATLKKLTGAELYSMHCNRCHAERYPTERTAAQWKTILLHMRVRANLPAEQSRTILKYLQDNSGR